MVLRPGASNVRRRELFRATQSKRPPPIKLNSKGVYWILKLEPRLVKDPLWDMVRLTFSRAAATTRCSDILHKMYQLDRRFGFSKRRKGLVWLLVVAFVCAILTLDAALKPVHVIGVIAFGVFIVIAIILRKKMGNWWCL